MKGHGKHLISISGMSIFIFVLARQWSGMDTPDSSFYTSLALFGDQVTDRAPFDSYYWTRLGYIAPVRALTFVGGPTRNQHHVGVDPRRRRINLHRVRLANGQ